LKVARLYHLLRRSAILRVTYAYAGFKQDGTLPNLLTQSGEHCFTFCASTHLNNQVREIKQRLEEKNVGSFDQLIGRPDILTWLENVKVALESPQIGRGQKLINFLKERLLNIAASPNVENLSPQLPLKVGIPSSLEKMETFQKMDQGQQQETLNWIVAGALASDYLKLTTELGFRNTGNGFQGKNNPRATAILIYDSKVSAENFLQSDYRSEGVFSTWTNLGTEPIH